MSQHAKKEFPADCRGEKCPNFKTEACTDSQFEWIRAKATVVEGRETDKPPLVDETVFITYGQVCLMGAEPQFVHYRIDDYGNESFPYEETGLIIHGDSRFSRGTDIDLYTIKVTEDGSINEELERTFDGWGS